jgi:adenylate cyclase
LAADVAGYSRLMGADEVGTARTLREHRAVIDALVAKHGGRIVKTTGDGVLLEFPSVVDAVECAVAVQAVMVERNEGVPAERRMLLRIGINLGDILIEGEDILGDGVNIAARIENECDAGGVYLSDDAYRQVRGKTSIAFDDLGERSLKNIDRPVRLYAVRSASFSTETAAKSPAEALKPLPLPDKPSIAVLPFQNMSGDPEQEYFTDGMVEEIITALSRFESLFVIARNSTFTYKGKALNIKQVGRELGVRYVMEGSVRKAASRLRITGQLIDAATGRHLWADHFDGGLDDVFELQDRVTSSVVAAIAPKLEQAEIERARRKPTESLDAYDYFLRAMASVNLFTRDGFLRARPLFHRATELDPAYAAPYGMAAWCVVLARANGWLTDLQRETAEAVELARRAAAIGKGDPTALWSNGMCLGYLAGEIETGITLVDRALALNPNLAMAWGMSGWLHVYLGKHAEAIECFERAMRLNPLDHYAITSHNGICFALLFVGRYEEAASWARKGMLEQPDSALPARVAAAAYALSGKIVEAREAMARMRALDPSLRLSNLENVLAPYRCEDRAHYVEGLRKAGLPE